MKKVKIEPKKTFWTWLHKNRIKVLLIVFLLIAPITLISAVYVGSYTSSKVVNFDAEVSDTTVYVKKFLNPDGINAFDLNLVWDELKYPVLDDTSGTLSGGYYKFSIDYTAKDNYVVKSVSVTPVLQTLWGDMRSLGTTITVATTPKYISIAFNYDLPAHPLWFVTVNEPTLYLKVDYVTTSGGKDLSFTEYVVFSLKDLNPLNVVPNA